LCNANLCNGFSCRCSSLQLPSSRVYSPTLNKLNLKRTSISTAVKRLLEQPAGSLLRLIRVADQREPGKGNAQYETVCECDGSFCGAHEGICGNARILDSKSFIRAMACKLCNTAHQASALAASARQRKFPDSPEIDEVLRTAYRQSREYTSCDSSRPRGLTLKEIALRFGRTRAYLRRRAEELNLTRRRIKRCPKWTEEEQRILERSAHLSCQVIQKRLGKEGYERTIGAIRDRITLHHLRQGTPYYRQEELSRLLGVSAQAVRRWMREGLIRCQRMQTASPTDPLLVHRNEIRRFIQRNPMAVDLKRVDQFWFLDLVFDGKIGETVETVLCKTASRSPSGNLETVTYHEAGHAVMAHVQHWRIKSVTVGKRAGSPRRITAHPLSDWFKPDTSRPQTERQILILLAGQIAQNLFTGKRNSRGKDFPQAKMLAGHVACEETELNAFLRWLWIRARNILNEPPNWAAVKALAQALRAENEVRGLRTIGEPQAKTIIERVLSGERA